MFWIFWKTILKEYFQDIWILLVYANVVSKWDPTLIVPGQSEKNRLEFHNAFILREDSVISLWFKQKSRGEKALLILNTVVYAHKTQNLHLKNQCYIHVRNDDVSFGQTLTINLN